MDFVTYFNKRKRKKNPISVYVYSLKEWLRALTNRTLGGAAHVDVK